MNATKQMDRVTRSFDAGQKAWLRIQEKASGLLGNQRCTSVNALPKDAGLRRRRNRNRPRELYTLFVVAAPTAHSPGQSVLRLADESWARPVFPKHPLKRGRGWRDIIPPGGVPPLIGSKSVWYS